MKKNLRLYHRELIVKTSQETDSVEQEVISTRGTHRFTCASLTTTAIRDREVDFKFLLKKLQIGVKLGDGA
jgi:hypothetical protein